MARRKMAIRTLTFRIKPKVKILQFAFRDPQFQVFKFSSFQVFKFEI